MLIHLDPSAISGAMEDGPEGARSLRCVEHLLLAHRHGYHIASIAPEDALRFVRSPAFRRMSEAERGALERIFGTSSEIAGLRDALPFSMVVGLGAPFDGRIAARDGSGSLVQVSLHHFDDLMRVTPCVLLCENATDSALYRLLGRLLLAERGWRSVTISCEPRGGGGSQIGPELRLVAGAGRILLAIADGDQRCPGGARGATARGLLEAASEAPGFQHAHVLAAREVENLVPLDVYRLVLESAGGREPQLSALYLLRPLSAVELRHADIKDGITLHQIDHRMTAGSPEHAMWHGLAERRGRTRCWRPGGVECTRREECGCYVVEKLGAAILEDVVRWLEQSGYRAPRRTAQLLGLSEGSALKETSDKVVAWTCASQPLLT